MVALRTQSQEPMSRTRSLCSQSMQRQSLQHEQTNSPTCAGSSVAHTKKEGADHRVEIASPKNKQANKQTHKHTHTHTHTNKHTQLYTLLQAERQTHAKTKDRNIQYCAKRRDKKHQRQSNTHNKHKHAQKHMHISSAKTVTHIHTLVHMNANLFSDTRENR